MALSLTTKRPQVATELDASRATSGVQLENRRAVLIAQKLAAGSATANEIVLVSSKEDGQEKFGRGSIAALMVEKYFVNNSNVELSVVPQDDVAGVKATVDITVGGSPTATGTFDLYFDGTILSVPVLTTDTPTTIATAMVAKITADGDLPFTATNAAGVISVTARNSGEVGNSIRLFGGGKFATNSLPAGVTVNASSASFVSSLASGATNPDVAGAISAIPDEIYNYWIVQYNDTTNVGKIVTELDRRQGETVQLFGHAVVSKSDTYSNTLAYGNALNSQFLTVLGSGYLSATPEFLATAEFGGKAFSSLSVDPALPLNTLEMVNFIPSESGGRFSVSERESLLNNGITTHNVSRDGRGLIERGITTYQTNGSGAPDIAYLDITTPLTLSDIRESLINMLKTKFARTKIVNDGNPVGANTTTPKLIKGEIVSLASTWVDIGWVENIEDFKETLTVVRNESDPTRVDIVMSPNLVNGLQILNVKVQFVL